MSVIEIKGGPITHRYLMGRPKDELASMYMRMLRDTEQDAKDAERWRYGARHGFPVLSNLFRQDNQAAWGICVIAGTTHVSDTPEGAIDAAMNGANNK